MSEHYEVCVLGGQPAGFLCAALLAKRGKRVLLVDHGEGFDTYKQGGVSYPLFPLPLSGLRGFRSAEKVLQELGAQVDLARRYLTMKPALQVIFARHRLDLDGDKTSLIAEATREFKDVGAAFTHSLQEIDKAADALENALLAEEALPLPQWWQRFWQVRRLRADTTLKTPLAESSLFAELGVAHPLAELMIESARFLSYLDAANMGVQAILAQRALAGSVRLDSSGGSYLDLLADLATRAGCLVKRGAVVDQIIATGNGIVGIETAGPTRMALNADFFVNALYSPQLWQSLPQSRTLGRFYAQNARLRPRSKLYFHHFLVRQVGLSLCLGDNVLLLNGRRQAREGAEPDSAVWMSVRREHTQEHALISAAIDVKESAASSLPEQRSELRKRMRKQIERLLPFLAPFIVAESSPMAPSEWDEHSASGARRLDPWLLHPRYEPLSDALLGVSGLPFHTPYKNLYRVGRETLPGLGALGDSISARMSAGIIQKAAKS